jgi:hypothetical protein
MQRVGSTLGLKTTPSFRFRYSRYNTDEDTTEADINDWEPYPLADQLSIMAKLVLSFQHRDTEPSFTMILKGDHLISVRCSRFYRADGSKFYRFALSLHIITTYLRVHAHTPHALQLAFSPEAKNPFTDCEFVWASLGM